MSTATDRAPDFTIGQDDDGVTYDQTITDAFGAYVDLTGATVVLHLRVMNATAAGVDLTGSVVGVTPQTQARYTFLAADTAVPGRYDGNFEITLASTERITWPTGRRLIVDIEPAA